MKRPTIQQSNRKALTVITVFLAWLPLVGCGDGGSSGSSPTGPPARVSTVIAEGSFQIGTMLTAFQAGVPCDFVEFIEFNTSATGDIEAIVDWTFATNNLDMTITPGRCTCALVLTTNACGDSVASSIDMTTKPERITALNQPAGAYTLGIANLDEQARSDSGSYQVVLTR